jgi:hypothetical protein
MRKKNQKVTQLSAVAAIPEKGKYDRGTLPWAHDMTGQALDMAQKLETTARLLSWEPACEVERQPTDLPHMMGLFQEQLQQISDLLDEVRTVMEDTDPTILQAANA